ncbi:MAG: hypothetical protein LBV59_24025 [Sphingobacterium sp.]|jgi:hypothetical protein|uniref:hypothetical protein n=1 Tax=unclassified Sphingobacterium TaxID=2609468 RepID=UPI0028409D51|nr:hypothetical protein [Sphingobacterium sp.]MDR3011015.1 hypothetical protein [Sphingobacterium sp.]
MPKDSAKANTVNSADYINGFPFDYIETYSLQRGKEYNALIQILKPERHNLKVRKEKRNNLTDSEEIRLSELDALLGATQYLIDSTGRFHFSSQRTNTFICGNEEISLLKNILLTKTTNVNNWMCAPIYRDAIVFYKSSGEIISVLNICLSCEAMALDSSKQVTADSSTYGMLRKFFKEIGHHVES